MNCIKNFPSCLLFADHCIGFHRSNAVTVAALCERRTFLSLNVFRSFHMRPGSPTPGYNGGCLTIIPCTSYSRSRFLVRWLSGRKQRFAKAPYLKRVPRVRIPPSPRSIFRETALIRGRNLLQWCDPKDRQTYRYRFSETFCHGLSRAPLIPLIGIGLIGLGNYPNPSHQRRSHKAARERGLASARRMAETGRSLAFAGRCPFFAFGGCAGRAPAAPDHVRVGAVENARK